MMTGSERRTAIINQIKNSTVPVSGKALAAQYAVSRQVIVQDIALIRAAGHEIISTNRGYLLNEDASVQRTFKVTYGCPGRRRIIFYCGSWRKRKKCHGKPQSLWTYGSGAEYYFQA